jgi:hypothetical protein
MPPFRTADTARCGKRIAPGALPASCAGLLEFQQRLGVLAFDLRAYMMLSSPSASRPQRRGSSEKLPAVVIRMLRQRLYSNLVIFLILAAIAAR